MRNRTFRLPDALHDELDRLRVLGQGAIASFVKSAITEKLSSERHRITEAIEQALKERIEVERQRQQADQALHDEPA